jgi:hypothetical protein
MPKSTNWEQHIELTKIIRQHPDWGDERVLKEAGLHKLETEKVAAARREVEGEELPSNVQSRRSY